MHSVVCVCVCVRVCVASLPNFVCCPVAEEVGRGCVVGVATLLAGDCCCDGSLSLAGGC